MHAICNNTYVHWIQHSALIRNEIEKDREREARRKGVQFCIWLRLVYLGQAVEGESSSACFS